MNIMWDCMNRGNIAEHSMEIYMSAHTHTPHKHSMEHNMGVCEHSMGVYDRENIVEHSMKIYMSAHTHTRHKHSMKMYK